MKAKTRTRLILLALLAVGSILTAQAANVNITTIESYLPNDAETGVASSRITWLDIKPGSCPNPLNTNTQGKGRLPMAILGTAYFDVSEIDVASISIAGVVLPVRPPVIEDVATPLLNNHPVNTPLPNGVECACHELEGDGFIDLVIHFSRQEIILALGLDMLPPGTVVPITVTGWLLDGTPFAATDCVTLVGRGD
ncbi:MAG: hypothetical protein ACYTF1_16635 [Planctomycetota bacterium]|jgi:hypothetical protein